MPAPFSRLQLAAALIEYDNDLEDPEKPKRSAQESAIFLPFRNRPLRPPAPERRSTDYLGVALPSETGSIAPRDSLAFDRRSRASIDALRNPFARESTYEGGLDDDEEEELEVDLASWGLDALVPKDKPKHSRKKTKSDALPNPYEQSVPVREVGKPHAPHTRAMSVNMLNGLGDGGAFLDSHSITPPPLGPRRHSIGDPLNVPTSHSADNMFPPRSRSRSPSAHALIDNLPLHSPLHSVPFPSSETVRSPSPQADGAERPRAQSSLSMGSRALLNDDPRFDPRSARGRTLSSGSMSNMLVAEPQQADEDNPFALRPPSPSRMSRFDPKAQRARTISQGTLATQMMLDDRDAQLERDVRPPHDRRYSRMELMRPKVLIMPSPLQSQSTSSAQPGVRAKEGFELSTDGRPLPPGARAARRSSVTLSVLEPGLNATPVASNSFTPNPRSSLTLSQLVFRNTLMVDGERDVAYADIEGHLRRATEDGEKVEPEPEPEPEIAREVPIVQVDEPGQKRPVGKLYGRSLIDDLEARKAEMRGKQRVFRGDERPSMMARSSTLINPDELKRPTSQHLASFNSQPNLTRRNSVNAKPLLEFEEELPGAPRKSMLLPGSPSAGGNTRSVFGVDTVWQRELAKLKVIEEQERREEEARKQREAAEEAKNAKKRGKKKKGKGRDGDDPSPALTGAETLSPALNASPGGSDEKPPTPPHVLPEIPKTVRRRPPPPGEFDDESDEESDDSDAPAPPRRAPQTSGWHSDEEEEGPRRTTGTGPRYPQSGPPRLPQVVPQDDDSSEEDVPLVATIGRAAQRQTRLRSTAADDSSDEDKPLTALLDKTRQKLPSLGGSQLSPTSLRPGPAGDDEDEDDMPLGLRASRIPPGFGAGGDDDDDKPLGMHPEQLRKSQFFMAAQQQQQQQMLAQAQMAQMQHAMMYATPPSMMGSGYFGPPMPPPMMMYPQMPPTPPPIQDKLGRVDKWRHDVAVEGERS